jgi:phosphate transport system substrate-binding protein
MKRLLDRLPSFFQLPSWRRLSCLLATATLVAGCPADKQSPGAAGNSTPTSSKPDKVVIRGSNTIGEELAPQLIAEFKKDHPKITFDLEAKATGYGLAALRAGQCDIAAASRPLIAEETDLNKTSGIEMGDHILGAYSVAVVVNVNNPVKDLTTNQVHGIFTGAITNWSAVGGPDAPIQLFIRDPISGTHLGFKELAMNNDHYAPHPTPLTNYATIVQAVAADPNGIGYSGIVQAASAGTRVVTIGGVAPSAEAVHNGQYPYARTLHFYVNKAKVSDPTREFVQFVLSPRGQEIVGQLGFTPKP